MDTGEGWKDREAYRSAQNVAMPAGAGCTLEDTGYHGRFPPTFADLDRTPEKLDDARRSWLAGLSREHALRGSAATALALARGEWMCGEYDAALMHFQAARDLDPASPETHLSLVRAASMLGMDALETAAIGMGLQRHPAHAELRLHAALQDVPSDLPAARRMLQPVSAHPLCRQFDAALAVIAAGVPPAMEATDPRQQAQLTSLHWVLRHAKDAGGHAGLPVQVLMRALDAAHVDGMTLECGVYFGRSLRLIAARTVGTVHGFDSFQGLPEAWNTHEGAGAYSTAGRLPHVATNVTLHAGWFEDTLPAFFASRTDPIRLLHIDCDLYSSTRTVLEQAGHRLVPGSVVVFDDLLGYPGYEQHELRAFEEFVSERKVEWELIGACLLGREVAVRITRI
jgi:hypothetical protein